MRVQQQGEDWNHHPIAIQGKKPVLNPILMPHLKVAKVAFHYFVK
jgi:hypothetical protein